MNEFQNRHITVMGLGRSGVAVAKILKENGARVFGSDNSDRGDIARARDQLHALNIECEIGRHSSRVYTPAELIVLSPGIPTDIPILREASALGIPIVSEVEIAYRLTEAQIIGITGTNGKSTVTSFLGDLLNHDGQKAVVAGNIGYAVSGLIEGLTANDYLVIELSSFQLETIEKFRPQIALLLNITPDHLDRYADVDDYIAAKKRIFVNQAETDFAVLNYNDAHCVQIGAEIPSSVKWFGFNYRPADGPFATEEGLWRRQIDPDQAGSLNYADDEFICRHDELTLAGPHNLENILAALTAGHLLGVSTAAMRKTLTTFKGLRHRIEFIREINGVRFYNDSKATTVESTIAAVNSFQNVRLIAGGKDKGSDFSPLIEPVKNHVVHLTLIGQAKERMAREIGKIVPMAYTDDFAAAIASEFEHAQPGDVILLSPACSSYDMFRDYEERGDQFRKIVESLPKH